MTTAPGNLPASFTSFVGRRRDIAEIRRLLGRVRLLTLTGVGGVGKTRLALAVAAASRSAFEDGTWLVDLAAVQDPARVTTAAVAALGVPDRGTRSALDQLVGRLAGRRALLVLDNCEHLVAACAELVQVLLSAAPEVYILATSRRTLGIAGERIFTVAPLSVPDEAVELLRDRTMAVRPQFRVTDDNRTAVARLCADLDGLPLAIELAASRLRSLTAEQVADRLEDRFALLTSGSRIALPRHRTLRALIDWSYELCSPAERLLWNRLSVFSDGFGLDSAEDICAGDGIARRDVLELLGQLVAQSIVLTTEGGGPRRYRMLETVRQYGRTRLAESGQEKQLLERHRDHFLALSEGIADGWYGPGQEESLARLHTEHGNLLAALGCGGDPQATMALAAALRYHWCVGGFLGEGRRQLDRALAAAPEPTPSRADALWVAAWVALLQGDHPTADQWLAEAGDLGMRLDDAVVCAYVQGMRGISALFNQRPKEAAFLLEGSAAAQTAAVGAPGAAIALFQLAAVQSYLADPRAEQTGRQAVGAAQAHGERWSRSRALWALGYGAWVRGDHETALERTRAALEMARGFSDHIGTGLMLELLAWITASRGEHERAAQLMGAVRCVWRDTGTTLAAFGPYLAECHAQCEDAVVRALGPAAYEKALAHVGVHHSPGQAIAYALDTDGDTEPAAPASAPNTLTRREREVTALVTQGMSNRQIAAALVLSPRTVDGHIDNIRAKLGFNSRARIAAWWAAQTPTQ
ncbi:ATP-binding protein [Streptomyces sp. NPDC002920]